MDINRKDFEDAVKSLRNYTPPEDEWDVQYRTSIHKNKKGDRPILLVRIGENVARELKWGIGLQIKLMQSKHDKKQLLMTPSKEGYMLIPSSVSVGKSYKDTKGEYRRCIFSGQIRKDTSLPKTGHTTIEVKYDIIKDTGLKYNDLLIKVPRMGKEI